MEKSLEAWATSADQYHNFLNAREAAAYLRISLSTLHRMERKGSIISLRTPGGHRRYTTEMLNACLSREIAVE